MKPKTTLWSCLMHLCHGDPTVLRGWLRADTHAPIGRCVLWLILGSGVYGATIGLWRSPLQSLYVAIKFPLLIGLTTAGTTLLNGMLAQLFGRQMSFRASALAVIMSYSILAIILGSLSSVTLFLLYNLPAMTDTDATAAHRVLLLVNVVIIAIAGIAANSRLYALLVTLHSHRKQARNILIAWLAGNLFLGAQLSWNLRPFFGTPTIPVQFLRDNPFDGTFYESVFRLAIGRQNHLNEEESDE